MAVRSSWSCCPTAISNRPRPQAERLRVKMNEGPMIVDGVEMHVSASFGVTVSDGSERNPDVFVRVADEALYSQRQVAGTAFPVWGSAVHISAEP
jgi:GGDEF domain-containing protein